MPVYKEGLEAVIVPTIESLKKAITTYERQGGTVSILICEDGMQLWSEADAEVRKAYYDRNAIGWVARPKHGKDGFMVRRMRHVIAWAPSGADPTRRFPFFPPAQGPFQEGLQHELCARPLASRRGDYGRDPACPGR
jgi:hypothetical protein